MHTFFYFGNTKQVVRNKYVFCLGGWMQLIWGSRLWTVYLSVLDLCAFSEMFASQIFLDSRFHSQVRCNNKSWPQLTRWWLSCFGCAVETVQFLWLVDFSEEAWSFLYCAETSISHVVLSMDHAVLKWCWRFMAQLYWCYWRIHYVIVWMCNRAAAKFLLAKQLISRVEIEKGIYWTRCTACIVSTVMCL